MECAFSLESNFGPAVASCRRAFDFTVAFEEIVFTILPSSIFLVAASVQISTLLWTPTQWSRLWHFLNYQSLVKLCTLFAFAGVQLATLVLTSLRDRADRTRTSLPAAALSFVAAVALVVWSALHHARSRRPSLLIGLYLFITVLLRSAIARTCWLIEPHGSLASTTLASVVIQLVLMALEELAPSDGKVNSPLALDKAGKLLSQEEKAGFLGRSILAWLDPLLWTGYRGSLTGSKLMEISLALRTSRVALEFERMDDSFQTNNSLAGGTDPGLLWLTWQCLGLTLLYPVVPRLCLTGFTFAQPFLASSLISYLSTTSSAKSDSTGYGLIGASFLIYAGIAVSTSWYWNLVYRYITKIRGAYVNAISLKLMRCVQEKDLESKAMTLMVSDVQRITGALAYTHEFWAAPIETAIGTWLLWRQVGPSSITVLGVALICTAGSTFMAKHIGKQQQIWLKACEKRIAATKKMLASLKAIKMMGSSAKVARNIERLRELEFAASKLFRAFMVSSVFISYSTQTLAPVVVFGVYIGATSAGTDSFDASRLFSSLILISLLASPLVKLLQIIPQFGAALGCIERFQDFLKRDQVPLLPANFRTSTSKASSCTGTQRVLSEKLEVVEKVHTASVDEDVVLSIRNADVGWKSDESVLKGIDLSATRGQHIAIMGPTGSGKSILLRAILGEAYVHDGTIDVKNSSTISYCAQTPWLENIPAYDNAFRFAPDDSAWRQEVANACAIRTLLDSQQPGEAIGSGGSKLSGGEKQRLALARAVSSRPSLLLLDDTFSAIDRSTKAHIRRCLFDGDGILHRLGTTIIHVTQEDNMAQNADKILRVNADGRVEVLTPVDQKRLDGDLKMEDTLQQGAAGEEMAAPAGNQTTDNSNSAISKPKEATKVSDLQVYRTYFGSIGVLKIVIFAVCGILFAFTLKFPDIWAKWWADASSEKSSRSIGYWMGLYTFLSVLPLIMVAVWLAHLMLEILPASGLALHRKLLDVVLGASFTFISGVDSGSIINRFNQDLMFVDSRLPLSLLNTVSGLLTCVIQVVLVVVPAIYLLATFPLLVLVLTILQHFYLRTSKQLRQSELQSKASLHTKLSEAFEGLPTIRAQIWQGAIHQEFQEKLDRSQEPFYLLYMVQTWLGLVLNLLVAGLSVAVVGVAIAVRRSSSASGIGLAILNVVTLGQALSNFITPWTMLETSLGAIARIKAFEEDTMQEPREEGATDPPPRWPSFGEIVFDKVWATYSQDDTSPVWALKDISFRIRAGEKLAICGRTGSGKSTLMMSLLSLVEVSRGNISIDGLDINHVSRSALRSQLCTIPQDPYLDGDSIREAIDPEGLSSDEDILDTLQHCGLMPKIRAPIHLGSDLSDINLSPGETQLFVLARTLLKAGDTNGGLLLFDEATSSIDIAIETKMMSIIRERCPAKTVISILHRLETAVEFDRIIVLEDGSIRCSGTPDEVIRQSELFSSLRKAEA